ncbi:MAG TPA: CBS domain-containing protein [Anaerolineaceae bacterium]|nr:CBS domain-containing protein [Anaerolineaceae bacterium]HPN53554.1 CBS domain-containing protein [Anaerolineaceae bacterium]
MAYLSEILGKPVTDPEGKVIGHLEDVVAAAQPVSPHPVVVAAVVSHHHRKIVVPFSDVLVLFSAAIPLVRQLEEITPYAPGNEDLYLAEDVLDKQIVDTDDIRVVRVNDLELLRVNNEIYVSNVDVGVSGLLRRIGIETLVRRAAAFIRRSIPATFISWDDVELLAPGQHMRLRVPTTHMSDLHPADLANILSDLNHKQSTELLDSLDVPHLADALEEIESDFQVSIVQNMSDEKVADVLEEMAPDEAADLLGELSEERSAKLLNMMDQDEVEDVRKLLAYPDDSAGGIMTTKYISIRPGLTAEKAIQVLRETAQEAETIFYVYVTDEQEHILGVISLSDLVLANPQTPVDNFMHKRIITVLPQDGQDECAQLVARYNLLALPVTDENGVMLGIVTSDDALDKIIPTAWKKRLPRYFR